MKCSDLTSRTRVRLPVGNIAQQTAWQLRSCRSNRFFFYESRQSVLFCCSSGMHGEAALEEKKRGLNVRGFWERSDPVSGFLAVFRTVLRTFFLYRKLLQLILCVELSSGLIYPRITVIYTLFSWVEPKNHPTVLFWILMHAICNPPVDKEGGYSAMFWANIRNNVYSTHYVLHRNHNESRLRKHRREDDTWAGGVRVNSALSIGVVESSA